MKFDEKQAKVVRMQEISAGIFDMWIETLNIAEHAIAGQFVSVYTKDPSKLLPRPISICEVDGNKLRLVFRVAGAGTKEFAGYQVGDDIRIVGPLGNGYPLYDEEGNTKISDDQHSVLIGGGIGIPPMLQLARSLPGKKTIVVGYRSNDTFLLDDLKVYGDVVIATDDGSLGTHGTVIDAIKAEGITGDVIYSCGPTPMLRAVKAYAEEQGVEAYLSLEEKMACGIGACLACVCQSTEVDHHSNVHNKRVCADGPVFEASQVTL